MTAAPIQPATGRCPFVDHVRGEVARTVVGQDAVVERVLIALLTGGHLLLEGVPGIAKTLLVQSVAKAIDLRFARVQFTIDLLPGDIVGSEILDQRSGDPLRDLRVRGVREGEDDRIGRGDADFTGSIKRLLHAKPPAPGCCNVASGAGALTAQSVAA